MSQLKQIRVKYYRHWKKLRSLLAGIFISKGCSIVIRVPQVKIQQYFSNLCLGEKRDLQRSEIRVVTTHVPLDYHFMRVFTYYRFRGLQFAELPINIAKMAGSYNLYPSGMHQIRAVWYKFSDKNLITTYNNHTFGGIQDMNDRSTIPWSNFYSCMSSVIT